MNSTSAIRLAFVWLLLSFPSAQAASAEERPAGQLYLVKGTVQITQGKAAPRPAANLETVFQNTLISTGKNSAALLKFSDGQVVSLLADTAIRIRNYQYNVDKVEDSVIVLSMIMGDMRFITGKIGQQNKQAFRLATPNATVGIRGTDFMLAMDGRKMYSHVQSGSIAMTNATGIKVVEAGQNALAASSTSEIALVSASAVPSGIFSELLAMPVDPTAIAAPVATKDVAPAVEAAVPSIEPAVALAAETLAAPMPLATLTIADPVAIAEVEQTQSVAAVAVPPTAIVEEKPQPAPEPEALSVVETIPEAPPESRNEEPARFASRKFGTGVAGKIGSLGYGGELAVSISDDMITARFGVNTLTYNYNSKSSEIDYDFKLQLQTASALVDIYPFKGSFRTSIGLMYNNNSLSLTAKPTGGTYTINGTAYPTSSINSVRGSIDFSKTAPYLGIGWGNPVAKGKGWGMVTDIGVLFQGAPKSSLTANCATTLTTTQCNTLQTALGPDVAAENAKLQNDLRNFKYWPVASIGISYQW